MSDEEREAWLDGLTAMDEWPDLEEDPDPEEYLDPDGPPGPGEDELTAEEIAGIRQAMDDQAHAAAAAARMGTTGMLAAAASPGRRGPGQPGSAHRFPGESSSRAAAFASGLVLDLAPGCPELAGFADAAAGPDDSYDGVSDDELTGVLCAWDRLEAHMAARKIAAVAELIRRRPDQGCELTGPARMPGAWDEFVTDELFQVLAEARGTVASMLMLAHDLEVKLPGTRAAFRDGILRQDQAAIIAAATRVLDPAEARAAEAMVLDRAGRQTPDALRAAIGRAVIAVAPDKAKKRREQAARNARVQRWAEDSGNAALMGRELPPAEVLAADQRIGWWARQLKKAGLDGSMDELRARAYLDLLLGKDSGQRQPTENGQDGAGQDRSDQDGAGQDSAGQDSGGPDSGGPDTRGGPVVPAAGFAGRVNLIVPLATLAGLGERPGELPALGPIDPDLARELAGAAARHPRSAWCVTVTDGQGHAIGHGCARPESRSRGRPEKARPAGGHDPPLGETGNAGFTFTAASEPGPPGGYGAWRLSTGGPGQASLLVSLEPIAIDTCDHRYEAKGHDPGVKLRHLAQIRHTTCTAPNCRRPAMQSDFEHNIPYEAGGRTCLCNGGPKCRHDHRLKQQPRWKVEQLTPGTLVWTTPSGRQFTTEPTRYPI